MATADEDTVRMGPEGDQWHCHQAEKLYDLTRSGKNNSSDSPEPLRRPLTMRTTAGAPDTQIAIDPRRTALVVVDMQNFFLHPRCRDHPTGRAAVAPTLRVVAGCRRAGIRVVWLNWGLTEADVGALPAAVVAGFARGGGEGITERQGLGADLGSGRGRMLMRGAWNAAVYGPQLAAQVRPDLGDVQCAKTRMSGLWSAQEPLRQFLAKTDTTRTLLFAGVNTDQCVLGTLADAYNQGWDCVAVEDCCATTTPGAQATTMANVAKCYGFVVDSATFAEGVEAFCAGD